MGIKVKDTGKKAIIFNSSEFREYAGEADAPHLALFIGLFEPDKEEALQELSDATGRNVSRYDFNDLVSKIETEAYRAIDKLFEDLKETDDILWFSNGDKLCGAYTGFSHSLVKYATPQERYFLGKLKKRDDLFVVIDITEPDGADETIIRAADAIVKFPVPKSPIRRMLWGLRNYSLHGYDIKTKRPEGYDSEEIATD